MSKIDEAYAGRLTGEYIANQVTGVVQARYHQDHKQKISDMDKLYNGELRSIFPHEDLPKTPLVENKFKNALHDLVRLASEAKPVPQFMRLGDDEKAYRQKQVREQIVDTEWEMAGGPRIERKLYMDLIGAAYCAAAAYYNEKSEYPQVMRLDPRYCYPDVRNGALFSLLYVETLPRRVAEIQWPGLNLEPIKGTNGRKKADDDLLLVSYWDGEESCQTVMETTSRRPTSAAVVSRWEHKLGCIPVGFVQMDSFDGTFHGMFDQLGGPIMVRNKVVALLTEYLNEMVHAPYEEKNIINGGDVPGPLTIYQHDPNADDSFIRRVAPAAPAGAVFGMLDYMESQEAKEAIQPPSRVGSVSQSIASGSFVASTQGSLSSAVKEMQDLMGIFREEMDYILMRIDEVWMDETKGLLRSVGKKATYRPSTDIAGKYKHRILFGAAAGLDRQYADVRILQHQSAGFISKETARSQIDYIDDASSEQNKIDREQLANIVFQRFASDPNAPLSAAAQALIDMGNGDSLLEAMEKAAPALIQAEQAAAPTAPGVPGAEGLPPSEPGAEQLALEKGAIPEEQAPAFQPEFAPPPLNQVISSNRI